MTQPLLTHSSARVAALFVKNPNAERYGLELIRDAGSTKGTVYPMLTNWKVRGWLTERNETDAELADRREPGARRKFYRLTEPGRVALTQYLARWDARQKDSRVKI